MNKREEEKPSAGLSWPEVYKTWAVSDSKKKKKSHLKLSKKWKRVRRLWLLELSTGAVKKNRVSWVLRRRSAHGLLLQHALIPGEKIKTNQERWSSFRWNTVWNQEKAASQTHQTHRPTSTDSRGSHAMAETGRQRLYEACLALTPDPLLHPIYTLTYQIQHLLQFSFNSNNVEFLQSSVCFMPSFYSQCLCLLHLRTNSSCCHGTHAPQWHWFSFGPIKQGPRWGFSVKCTVWKWGVV